MCRAPKAQKQKPKEEVSQLTNPVQVRTKHSADVDALMKRWEADYINPSRSDHPMNPLDYLEFASKKLGKEPVTWTFQVKNALKERCVFYILGFCILFEDFFVIHPTFGLLNVDETMAVDVTIRKGQTVPPNVVETFTVLYKRTADDKGTAENVWKKERGIRDVKYPIVCFAEAEKILELQVNKKDREKSLMVKKVEKRKEFERKKAIEREKVREWMKQRELEKARERVNEELETGRSVSEGDATIGVSESGTGGWSETEKTIVEEKKEKNMGEG